MRTLFVMRAAPVVSEGYPDEFVTYVGGRAVSFRGSSVPTMRRNPYPAGHALAGEIHALPPGEYEAVPAHGHVGGRPAWRIVTSGGRSNVPVWSDYDHDGRFSASDVRRSGASHITSDAIALHVGGAIPAIGCLTVAPAQYPRFVAAMGGAASHFRIVVVAVTRGLAGAVATR